jgi:hypothetical protein
MVWKGGGGILHAHSTPERRYYWMLGARTRLLYAATSLSRQCQELRQTRKAFLDELNKVRDAYAESLHVPQ